MDRSPQARLVALLADAWTVDEQRRLAVAIEPDLAKDVAGGTRSEHASDLVGRVADRGLLDVLVDRMAEDRPRRSAEIVEIRAVLAPVEPTTGPYVLLERLGEGSAAIVHRARHVVLGVEHAVKVLRAGADDAHRARFSAEAQVLAALDHPNLPRVFGAGEGDSPWIALELAPGGTLAERVRHGPEDPRTVVGWALEALGALEALHAQGYVHRDVKPANLLVGKDGRIKLCDLGAARTPSGRALASASGPPATGRRSSARRGGRSVRRPTCTVSRPRSWRSPQGSSTPTISTIRTSSSSGRAACPRR